MRLTSRIYGEPRAPNNATAALVIRPAKPEDLPPERKWVNHWKDCPPLREQLPRDTLNLGGIAFGRLTVIFLHATLNGKWVCRCACGCFTIRTARHIKGENPQKEDDCCQECYHWKVMADKGRFHTSPT